MSAQRWRADQVLLLGLAKFPDDAEMSATYALVADLLGAGEASLRWRRTLALFPDIAPFGDLASARFVKSGDYLEAEGLLARLCAEFPDNADYRVRHAQNAEHLDRWQNAIKRWEEIKRLRPNDVNMGNALGVAIWNAARDTEQDVF